MNPQAPSLIKKKKKNNSKSKLKTPTLEQLSYTSDLSIFSEADLVFGLGRNSLLVIIIKLQWGMGERLSLRYTSNLPPHSDFRYVLYLLLEVM